MQEQTTTYEELFVKANFALSQIEGALPGIIYSLLNSEDDDIALQGACNLEIVHSFVENKLRELDVRPSLIEK